MEPGSPTTDDTDVPPVLYHYTDAAGLMGILNPSWPSEMTHPEPGSAMLRASDVRYMNDHRELRFGADLLAQRLREDAEANPDEMGDVFGLLADRLSVGPFTSGSRHRRAFAACFCANGDLLSQWRGYGGGVGGYAIGFPYEVLAERALALVARPSMFHASWSPILPVRYGEGPAAAAIEDFLRQLRSGWALPPDRRWVIGDEAGRPHIEWLMGSCYRQVAQLKHAAFDEEHEYRLIYVGGEGDVVPTRARAAGLVPFINFGINLPEGGKRFDRTIAEVIVGPGADQDGQVAAVRDLLQSAGYPPTSVTASDAPFKG